MRFWFTSKNAAASPEAWREVIIGIREELTIVNMIARQAKKVRVWKGEVMLCIANTSSKSNERVVCLKVSVLVFGLFQVS